MGLSPAWRPRPLPWNQDALPSSPRGAPEAAAQASSPKPRGSWRTKTLLSHGKVQGLHLLSRDQGSGQFLSHSKYPGMSLPLRDLPPPPPPQSLKVQVRPDVAAHTRFRVQRAVARPALGGRLGTPVRKSELERDFILASHRSTDGRPVGTRVLLAEGLGSREGVSGSAVPPAVSTSLAPLSAALSQPNPGGLP